MKKIAFGLTLLGFAFFLNACGTNETPPTPTRAALAITPFVATEPVASPTAEYSCEALDILSTATPSGQSSIVSVTADDFIFGKKDAPITLIEYCDFHSGGCYVMAQTIAELTRNFPDQIRLVFRPLPLGNGEWDKSDLSVLAALSANQQGKFWEMYNLLFSKYDQWANLSPKDFLIWLAKEAIGAGIDAKRLVADSESDEVRIKFKSAQEAAQKFYVSAVPLVFLNGALTQSYVLDYRSLSEAVGLILLGEKQFAQCPPFNIDAAKQYVATIETEKGNIVLQLFPDKAPLAVNSFVFLARQGWYDGVTFHRVIPGFIAQTGDPSGTGKGNPGYFFKNEISNLKFDAPGVVGMANSGPDANGSQFFITFAAADHLDGAYTIFGRVISGLDVVERLTPRDPSQGGVLPAGDAILRVTIDEK
ncbi:MAG: peptidylprolyl isomerase [Anaerolineales bacterium]|nr:peptidylprolyl isomerase [Anaerolineales bacterium]